jgi:4-amino-4-deoxy-L-arabinose transferase-like glycosyltransferase
MTLAWAPDADPKTLLLRWFAALWLAATALAGWNARRRPRSLLRSPVPLVFVVIAALCWTAST